VSTIRFKQVDAFSSRPFLGNPVAVVLDAEGLESEQMQRIAAWTNLSETTFVTAPAGPGPGYGLRIFTPQHELPFAGHPTIGSCHAVLEAASITPHDGRLTQECGAGNLPLRVEGDGAQRLIFVEAPEAARVGEYPHRAAEITAALGQRITDSEPPTAFRNGPAWLFVRLEGESDVATLSPDLAAVTSLSVEHELSGIAAFSFAGEGEFAIRIRCFAPAHGIAEDPVTGSANAALVAYLAHHGLLARCGNRYMATQGRELGRDGRVHVRVLDEHGRAEIGGQAVTTVDGRIHT